MRGRCTVVLERETEKRRSATIKIDWSSVLVVRHRCADENPHFRRRRREGHCHSGDPLPDGHHLIIDRKEKFTRSSWINEQKNEPGENRTALTPVLIFNVIVVM
jgi:hypothetical protein